MPGQIDAIYTKCFLIPGHSANGRRDIKIQPEIHVPHHRGSSFANATQWYIRFDSIGQLGDRKHPIPYPLIVV